MHHLNSDDIQGCACKYVHVQDSSSPVMQAHLVHQIVIVYWYKIRLNQVWYLNKAQNLVLAGTH